MRRTVLLLGVMAVALVVASGLALAQTMPEEAHTISPQTQPLPGEVIPGEYIVVLEDQPTGDGFEVRAANVAEQMATRYAGLEVKRTYEHALEGFAARIPHERLDEVKADPKVRFVSQNREVRRTFRQQVLPTGVDRIEADTSSTRAGNGGGSVGVGIAVIDDGIDADHPDLNVVGGKDCTSSGGFDGNADSFHGTHVAGTVAAKDNGFGVVGVAPGAPLYALRVFDEGDELATTAGIICAIDWVTAHSNKIEVANMSLGGFGRDDESCGIENRDALHFAICRSVDKGITYVVAAGNVGRNFKTTVPAAYDEVLTVTAMADNDGEPGGSRDPFRCYPRRFPASRDDTAALFSNFTTVGSDDADHTVAAPGVCILSTFPLAFPGSPYAVFSGTSQASPHVAGTAALYKADHPNASPQQGIEALRAEAREQPPSYGFRGDPHSPIENRYYGYLVHAGDF